MAVAHDSASESHTGTTGSASEASFTWNHAGASSGVKGALVFTFVVGATGDTATSVTYGGVAMTAVTGGRAVDTATEPGDAKAWYLGTAVPQGTQAVVVNRTNNANVLYANAITVTAAVDTEVNAAGIVLVQENQTLAEQSVSDGSIGIDSLRYAAIFWGASSVAPAGASSTALLYIQIAAARGAGSVRETTAGQGARSVGFASGTSDDVAAVHLAVREIVSATGAFAAAVPALSGTGTSTESGTTGTGAFAAAAASFAGTSTETFTGTGAVALAAASLAGTGTETITGTGTFGAAAASLAGTSTQTVTGSGAFAAGAAVFAGTGAETFTGTGAFAASAASLAGIGSSTEGISGTGAFAAAAASFTGTGTSGSAATPTIHTGNRKRKPLEFKPVPVPIIIGKGGFLAAPASLSGVGTRGTDPRLFLDDELLLLLA